MGRDIHLYLEIDTLSKSNFSEPEAFADGRIRIPRDYRLFQALAGLARVDSMSVRGGLRSNGPFLRHADCPIRVRTW